MKKTIFITATDTGVGKTFLCGLLYDFCKQQGVKAGYQKWVSTGGGLLPPDLCDVMAAAGEECSAAELDLRVPFRFEFPASPHLAAEMAGREVEPARIAAALEQARQDAELLIVEGVGGVMVPLRRDLLLADLLARFRLPALIVARSGLGTLNHTLLTIEALRHRNIPILGVVLTDSAPDHDERIVADNLRTLAEQGRVEVLGRLPWCAARAAAQPAFFPIGEKILASLG